MQSFKTNDGVTLRYIDTGADVDDVGVEGKEEGKRPWLVMVRKNLTTSYTMSVGLVWVLVFLCFVLCAVCVCFCKVER